MRETNGRGDSPNLQVWSRGLELGNASDGPQGQIKVVMRRDQWREKRWTGKIYETMINIFTNKKVKELRKIDPARINEHTQYLLGVCEVLGSIDWLRPGSQVRQQGQSWEVSWGWELGVLVLKQEAKTMISWCSFAMQKRLQVCARFSKSFDDLIWYSGQIFLLAWSLRRSSSCITGLYRLYPANLRRWTVLIEWLPSPSYLIFLDCNVLHRTLDNRRSCCSKATAAQRHFLPFPTKSCVREWEIDWTLR